MSAYRDSLTPTQLTRQIHTIQTQLTTIALTDQIQARANTPTTSQGIRQAS